MTGYQKAFQEIRARLQPLYDAQEAGAVAREVLLHVTGLTYSQALVRRPDKLTDEQEEDLHRLTGMLATGMPLQYALGYGWFMGRRFIVNRHVLIPRPETEELVQWIVEDRQHQTAPFTVLDIGTGSGCIPVSLKLALPGAAVTSCDISAGALDVAEANSRALGAVVDFRELDFLDKAARALLPAYDVIVSNPPYIPADLRETLHPNVRDFEPATALFVPDEDPLLFYRAIADFGQTHLKARGAVYCELHADHAAATETMFRAAGYREAVLREDMNGHVRMVKVMI